MDSNRILPIILLIVIASFLNVVFSLSVQIGYTAEEFTTIQSAINNADAGGTIYVPAGIYYEHLIVNKSVTILGEVNGTAIIDGSNSGTVVEITADNVTVAGFRIQNSGWGWTNNGIYVYNVANVKITRNYLYNNCHNIRLNYSSNSIVEENVIDGNGYGVRLINSVNCTAEYNNVSNCIGGIHIENATGCIVKRNQLIKNAQGIRIYSPCTYNDISGNIAASNTYDGMIDNTMNNNSTLAGNMIFHNNFINNTYPFICKGLDLTWNLEYPFGGNYWSRHNSSDLMRSLGQNETGSDGIVDSPYTIDSWNIDHYPLADPWDPTFVYNIKTGSTHSTIQAAIAEFEPSNDTALWINQGIYIENVEINKSVLLRGEDQYKTVIDSNGIGTAISIESDNVSISDLTIQNSGSIYPPYGMDCGIILNHTQNVIVNHCAVVNNRIGIYLFFANNSLLHGNHIKNNSEDGLTLWHSRNNTLTNNKMSRNAYNFGVFGIASDDFENNVDSSNTVDGKSISYVIGRENLLIENETDVGTLYLINCINITVQNLKLTDNAYGLLGYNLTNCTFQNITTTDNSYGVCLQDSQNNTVNDNLCLDNWVGIQLQESSYNSIQDNTAANCEKGISLYQSCEGNAIAGNTIEDSMYGIRMFSSNMNSIFHNNLVNNSHNVDAINSYENSWDNGFEGNFWSDYVGSDLNRDGIGDVVKNIDADEADRYPLVGTFLKFKFNDAGSCSIIEMITNSTVADLKYDSADTRLKIILSLPEGSFGFCRVRVPHCSIEPDLYATVNNGSAEVLYANFSIKDDGNSRWIYLLFDSNTQDITIVPESWVLLLAVIPLLFLICRHEKRSPRIVHY